MTMSSDRKMRATALVTVSWGSVSTDEHGQRLRARAWQAYLEFARGMVSKLGDARDPRVDPCYREPSCFDPLL